MASKLGGAALSAKFRAGEEQFKGDFYVDGGQMFCNFCKHRVDWKRRDTVVDHVKSRKHTAAKLKAKGEPERKKQRTLFSDRLASSTAAEERAEFQKDFVRMMTTANIPLDKTATMKPFFMKHSKNGGALTSANNLRDRYLPPVYAEHFAVVKEKLEGKPVLVIIDETTDERDKSVMNVLVGQLDKLYLIDVVFMDACNQQTVAQATLRSLASAGIDYNNVVCFVTDNAAYCKAAYNNILKNVLPNCIHVGCMAHILNLVGEDLVKDEYFKEVEVFVNDIKNIFKKRPARKSRFAAHLREINHDVKSLPPEPVATRWGTWFDAVSYHSTHLDAYRTFFASEDSEAENVKRVRRVLGEEESSDRLLLKMNFITESCPKIKNTLTKLEGNKPFAPTMYTMVDGLCIYLMRGTAKTTFGTETDSGLDKLTRAEKDEAVEHFHDAFNRAHLKFSKHVDRSMAMDYYKLCRVFDPRQLSMITNDITKYKTLRGLQNPSESLQEEWDIYMTAAKEELPEEFDLAKFWKGLGQRIPTLGKIATEHIWTKVTSVDAERSFSKYKHMLDDRRESLTVKHTKALLILYFNGDVEGRLSAQ